MIQKRHPVTLFLIQNRFHEAVASSSLDSLGETKAGRAFTCSKSTF